MSIDVSITHENLEARARLLRDTCFASGGEVVTEGLYSFPDREAADFFSSAAKVYLPGAVVVVGDIDELIPPDEPLGLDPLGTFVAEEIKQRRL